MRLIALVIGLFLNAMGNGLTITSDAGSGIWTAAAVNLHHIFSWQLGIIIFAFGVFNIIVNQFLLGHFDGPRMIGEFIYLLFFSYLINFFAELFISLGLGKWPFWSRIILAIIGVTMFCIAISLYQRANVFMHPNDDMSNLLRFKLLHGSAILSQFVDMLVPIIIIIFCYFKAGKIESVGIGTLYSLFCNGIIIKFADRMIYPKLIHNFSKNDL